MKILVVGSGGREHHRPSGRKCEADEVVSRDFQARFRIGRDFDDPTFAVL